MGNGLSMPGYNIYRQRYPKCIGDFGRFILKGYPLTTVVRKNTVLHCPLLFEQSEMCQNRPWLMKLLMIDASIRSFTVQTLGMIKN